MKIFRIIENPTDELEGIAWHMLPDSTLLRTDNPLFIPDFDCDFRAYPVLAVRIDRLGKSIAPRFAHRYFNEATIGFTLRAENLLARLRALGMPWDKAVAFDKSCILGQFLSLTALFHPSLITLRIGSRCEEMKLDFKTNHIYETIAAVSENNTVKTGDLVLMPVADKGRRLNRGENLTVECGSEKILEIRIK